MRKYKTDVYKSSTTKEVKDTLQKISKCYDPYQRIGYKVQTIIYAYGHDDCTCFDKKISDYNTQVDVVFNRRIRGLDLSLEQWIEPNKRENFVSIKIADTEDIVCDRIQHIMVDGNWEDTIDELFTNSLAIINAVNDNELNVIDGISFNANNHLIDKINEIFNGTTRCEFARKLCKDSTGEAVALDDKLIIIKNIAINKKDFKTINYRIFTIGSNCEEVYNADCIICYDRCGLSINNWVNSFKPGGWQEYILNYYDNMTKKLKKQIVKIW